MDYSLGIYLYVRPTAPLGAENRPNVLLVLDRPYSETVVGLLQSRRMVSVPHDSHSGPL